MSGIQGFTLLEITIVLGIIGLVAAGGLLIFGAQLQRTQSDTTIARMQAIDAALLNYAVVNGRIPCPAIASLANTDSNYGVEAANQGSCVGGTPAITVVSSTGSVEGTVPTRALQLPDTYMYDGWGRRFTYAVDPTMTVANALYKPLDGLCAISPSPLTIKDATAATRSAAGAYVLMSHGANGHCGYTNNGGTAINANITNADELTNCHQTSPGVSGTYIGTYVQKLPSLTDTTNLLTAYDDIVTYKEDWQLKPPTMPKMQGALCVYVADSGNNRVVIFDTSGNYKGQISGFYQVQSLVFDKNNILWTLDFSPTIGEYKNGTYIPNISHSASQTPPTGTGGACGFDKPHSLAIDAWGNFWVNDSGGYDPIANYTGQNNRIVWCSSNNTIINQFTFYGASGTAIDPVSGNVWISSYNNSSITIYDKNGNYLNSISGGHMTNIAFDKSGHVYVLDGSNGWVDVYLASNGVEINGYLTFPGLNGSNAVSGLAINPNNDNDIWVTATGTNSVYEYTLTGGPISGTLSLVRTINGSNITAGAASFSSPKAVTLGYGR